MIKRIFSVVLVVFVLIGVFSVSAFAAEADDSTLLPSGNYEGYYDSSSGVIEFEFPGLRSKINLDLDLILTIDGVTYSDSWHLWVEDDLVNYYSGNFDEVLNGVPYYAFLGDDEDLLYLKLFGPFSSNIVTLEITQGSTIILDPVPGPDIENMEGGASAHYATISNMLVNVLKWFGVGISAFFTGALSPLVPVFALAVAIPLLFFVIKFIRQFLR